MGSLEYPLCNALVHGQYSGSVSPCARQRTTLRVPAQLAAISSQAASPMAAWRRTTMTYARTKGDRMQSLKPAARAVGKVLRGIALLKEHRPLKVRIQATLAPSQLPLAKHCPRWRWHCRRVRRTLFEEAIAVRSRANGIWSYARALMRQRGP
eukprot:scaffold88402_cov28-Tisochrysis_lutea.AAC.3